MRKVTTGITLTLLAAAALSFTGCDDSPQAEVQTCVDGNNVIQDEARCQFADQQKAAVHQVVPSPIPYWWYYHWVFGGNRPAYGYRPGYILYGARMSPSRGYYTIHSTIVETQHMSVSSGRVSTGHVSYGGFGSTGGGGSHGGGGSIGS